MVKGRLTDSGAIDSPNAANAQRDRKSPDATAEAVLTPFGVVDRQTLAPYLRADCSDCLLIVHLTAIILCPMHPQFLRYMERCTSLQQQPGVRRSSSFDHSIENRAENGFFYNAGKRKLVCFYCNCVLSKRTGLCHFPSCHFNQLVHRLREAEHGRTTDEHPTAEETRHARDRLKRLLDGMAAAAGDETSDSGDKLAAAMKLLSHILDDQRAINEQQQQEVHLMQSAAVGHPPYSSICVPFVMQYLESYV